MTASTTDDKRRKVYGVLTSETGYTDDYNTFVNNISNEDKRKKVYEHLVGDTGYKDSYDEFEEFMGFGKGSGATEQPVNAMQSETPAEAEMRAEATAQPAPASAQQSNEHERNIQPWDKPSQNIWVRWNEQPYLVPTSTIDREGGRQEWERAYDDYPMEYRMIGPNGEEAYATLDQIDDLKAQGYRAGATPGDIDERYRLVDTYQRSFRVRSGGKDFYIPYDDIKLYGGLEGWAEANDIKDLRVYMTDPEGASWHVPVSVAEKKATGPEKWRYAKVDAPDNANLSASDFQPGERNEVTYLTLHAGGEDFRVSMDEINHWGGIAGYAKAHPDAEISVSMQDPSGNIQPVDAQNVASKLKAGWKYAGTNGNEDWRTATYRAISDVWADAEAKYKDDANRNAQKNWGDFLGGREMRIVNTGSTNMDNMVAHFTRKDMQHLMDETWKKNGTQVTEDCYMYLKQQYPNASDKQVWNEAERMARQMSDQQVFEYAKAKNVPKNVLEYFIRQVMDSNTISSITRGLARVKAGGKTGDLAAYEQANAEYGKEHRAAQVLGTGVGMTTDPTVLLGGAAGGGAQKAVAWAGGKFIANRGLTTSAQVGTRYFLGTAAGKYLAAMGSGMGNLMFYESASEGARQFAYGGHINPETGENEGYSPLEMIKSAGRGAVLGLGMGGLGTFWGNAGARWTGKATSTAGKATAKYGSKGAAFLTEGAWFAVPGIALEGEDPVDALVGSYATLGGIKAPHMVKKAFTAKEAINRLRPIKPENGRELTREERIHNMKSWQERWYDQLGKHKDISITKDDIRELEERGYNLSKVLNGDRKDIEIDPETNQPTFDGYDEMARLVEDRSLPQELRAKLYYIFSERSVAEPTITSHRETENEDGTVTVETFDQNGDVVTRRRLKGKELDAHVGDVERQVELNSIDIGEQRANAKARENALRRAADQIMPKGYDFDEFLQMYQDVKSGKDDYYINTGRVKRVDELLEESADLTRDESAEGIRERIEKEFDVNIDDIIEKRDGRSNNENDAMEAYVKALYPEEAARQVHIDEAQAHYEEAADIYDRFEEGDPTAGDDADVVLDRYRQSFEEVDDAFGDTAEEYWAQINEDPFPLLTDPELTIEQQDAVLNYINARAAFDGMRDRADESFMSKRQKVEQEIADKTHKDTGVIQEAIMKVDDREVYVIKGNVQMFPDGTGIDNANSDLSIVVKDKETGEIKFASPDQISRLEEPIDPAEEVRAAHAIIDEEQRAVNARFTDSEIADRLAAFGQAQEAAENMELNRMIAEEERAKARQKEEADIIRELEDEDMQAGYDAARTDRKYIGRSIDELKAEKSRLESELTPADKPASPNEASKMGRIMWLEDEIARQTERENARLQAEQEAEAERQRKELEGTPLGSIPVDKETGKRKWTEAEPETAWDALVQMSGEENAYTIAKNQRDNAQKELDTIKKQVPKKGKVNLSGDVEEMASALAEADATYKAAMEEHNAKVADAQAKYDKWQSIFAVQQARKDELKRQRDAETRAKAEAEFQEQERLKAEQEAERKERSRLKGIDEGLAQVHDEVKDCPEALEVLLDLGPKTVDEAAAWLLGGVKLLWSQSVDGRGARKGGSHGTKQETGFGEGERKKLFGLFASREKGGKTIEELAEAPMKEVCEQFGIAYDNSAARDALIDVVRSARTTSDITRYIPRKRAEQALEIKQAQDLMEREMEEAAFYDAHHMDKAEYEMYREVQEEAARENLKHYDEEEYNGRIADEIADRRERIEEYLKKQDENFDENEYNGNIADELASRERGAGELTVKTDYDGLERKSEPKGEREAEGGRKAEPEGEGRFDGGGRAVQPLKESDNGRGIGENADGQRVLGKNSEAQRGGHAELAGDAGASEGRLRAQQIRAEGEIESPEGSHSDKSAHRAVKPQGASGEKPREARNARLLTAFEKKETSESNVKTTDTDENPLDSRGDTALSRNSNVSEGKGNEKVADMQPKEVGNGTFGKIYDGFKGKAKAALDFLRKMKSGQARGVFHRDEIGDIDLVWGEAPNPYKGKGLAHIDKKHVELLGDFASLDEAIEVIDDVIKNGEIVANPNANNNIDIDKGNYRVSIAQDGNGRWVLTAFDKDTPAKEKKKRKDAAATGTPGQPDEGAGAVAPNLSEGKDSEKVGDGQVAPGDKPASQNEVASNGDRQNEVGTNGDKQNEAGGSAEGNLELVRKVAQKWLKKELRDNEEIEEKIMQLEAWGFDDEAENKAYGDVLRAELARREEEKKALREMPEYKPLYEALDGLKEANKEHLEAMRRSFDLPKEEGKSSESQKWAELLEAKEKAEAAFDKLSDTELAETVAKNPELRRAFVRDGLMLHGRTSDRIKDMLRMKAMQRKWEATPALPESDGVANKLTNSKMTDFTAGKKEPRAVLRGVYHDGGTKMAIATDSQILVASRQDYDSKKAGKLIEGSGKKQTETAVGSGGYPNYLRVIPNGEAKATAALTQRKIEAMQRDLRAALGGLEDNYTRQDATVAVRMPNGSAISVNAQKLEKFLGAMRKLGENTLEFWGVTRPLTARGPEGAVLVMPTVGGESDTWRIDLGTDGGKNIVSEPGRGYSRRGMSQTGAGLFDWRMQPGQQSLLDLMEGEDSAPGSHNEAQASGAHAPVEKPAAPVTGDIFAQAARIGAEAVRNSKKGRNEALRIEKEKEAQRDLEALAERCDEGIDSFQAEFAAFRERGIEIDAEREKAKARIEELRQLAKEEERELTADELEEIEGLEGRIEELDIAEQMDDEGFAEERERLENTLFDFYSRNNTEQDARSIAKEMAQRAMAEVEMRQRTRATGTHEADRSSASGTHEDGHPETNHQRHEGEVKTAGGVIRYEAAGHLPDAEQGEFAYAERVFTLSGKYSFTGAERVRSRGDVAFMFRALQTKAIENLFVVIVDKEGRPHVVHMTMGGTTATVFDVKTVKAAYDAFGGGKVYILHNHPSGNLTASPQDRQVMTTARETLGNDVEIEGLIIDTTSGKYADMYSSFYRARPHEQREPATALETEVLPAATGKEVSRDVYEFDERDSTIGKGLPSTKYQIKGPKDVVDFISSRRFNPEERLSYMVLNNAGEIVGNFHSEHTESEHEMMAGEMQSVAVKYGGEKVIVYGKVESPRILFGRLEGEMKGVGVLDVVGVKDGVATDRYGGRSSFEMKGRDSLTPEEIQSHFWAREAESEYGKSEIIKNIENGIDALRQLKDGAEEVRNAMEREDLEAYGGTKDVTFYLGTPGIPEKDYKKGYGILHIGSKHGPDAILRMISIIAEGRIERFVPGNMTVVLTDGKYEAVLALTKNGQRHSWLLTGWDKLPSDENGKVSTSTVSTQANPTFSREDLGAVIESSTKLIKKIGTDKNLLKLNDGAVTDARIEELNREHNLDTATAQDGESRAEITTVMTEVARATGIPVEIVGSREALTQRDKNAGSELALGRAVCGYTKDGKIFLNVEAMSPDTPLHEYTHLWNDMVRREKPELWERGKELLKETPLWEEVKNDPEYAHIRDNEDAVADEVSSRYSGRRGQERMEEMIREAKKRGPIAEAEAVSLVYKLKRWLQDMFKGLKETLGKWTNRELKDLSLEEFSDMTLRDFAEGLNPNKEMRRGEMARQVMEKNPMRDDYHTGIRGREDVKTFDEILKEAERMHEEDGGLTYPDISLEQLNKAKETGRITVYSSKPIENGVFVTPSRMNAKDYAGEGKVYSKEVGVNDIAWIDESEGQLAERNEDFFGEAALREADGRKFAFADSREEFERNRQRAISEKGIVMPGLAEKEIDIVKVRRHDFSGERPKVQAEEWARKHLRGKYKATDSAGKEFEYEISNRKIGKFLSETAERKSDNLGVHLAVLKKLPEVISKSIEAEVHPDYPKNNTGERDSSQAAGMDVLVHRFYGAVEIEGQTYRVKTTIQENATRGNKPHSYEVTKIELLDREPSNSMEPTGPTNMSTPDRTANLGNNPDTRKISGKELLFGVEKSYDPGVKLLDASAATAARDERTRFQIRRGREELKETLERLKTEAMQANTDNLQAKRDAMRAIGGNLNNLRSAMARQREYDITTVKSVTDLARTLMQKGLLDDISKFEVDRILGAVTNVVGRQDVSKHVQKVMDIMVDNQLRAGRNDFSNMLRIRGSRVDARGVEVQGELDPDGQTITRVIKKTYTLPKDEIDNRISEALNRMGSPDQAIADEAALEYSGLQIARQYAEDISESKAEEKALRDSIKEAKEDRDAGHMTDDAYKQYVASTEDAIRQNKIERAEAYQSLIEQTGDIMSDSIAKARGWRVAEVARVADIQHNANSDMEGRPTDEHHKNGRLQKLTNNSGLRFLFAPLGTFDQMLRMFGNKSARGEGYLWNRYMRGWVDATEKEYKGYQEAVKRLDEKVSEVFSRTSGTHEADRSSASGTHKGRGITKWRDLFALDRKLPKATVNFWDGGDYKDHELSQGNLLYIYMADKMADGRMKLRKMGITEEDVRNIENFLDPRFLELADWMQDEFLVDKRNEYNETHKRMFGASMAAIDNYFPLKILANARTEEIDVADDTGDTALPATSTGSIIKRRRNNLALDVTGANAFSVILDHLQQMERWNAFAEFNRDLNTLLSYKRFRNQVMNMSSVYGGGKTLWTNFRNAASMAAGAYRPPIATLDKAAVNIAKGVTAAKVSFRVFTALKQMLSMPAYLPDSNPKNLLKNLANPAGAWKWGMENLPVFEKRWKSRMAGDPRLMKTDLDWKAWRSNIVQLASRVGMSPNAFVDAMTVAIGARSMYETKKAKYLRWGMSEADAERRAKQDATILFNQTQQSSESAFLSTIQVDRSWLSVVLTVFRNSSMSYSRRLYDAMRNLGRRFTPDYKGMSEEFMAKQMRRDGIDPDIADREAKNEYKRGILRDLATVGVFGFGLQLAWNLGSYLPYLLLGDDDEQKDDMLDDAITHAMFGSIEGLAGGDAYSAALNQWSKGEFSLRGVAKDMPAVSDLEAIYEKFGKDKVEAMNDVINLLVQSSVGVNPQSLTDAVVAIMDYCGEDAQSQKECALLIARIVNCPQSQIDKIYFDEIDASAREASEMTPQEIAKRYARYKVRRSAPLTGWAYDEVKKAEKEGEKVKRVLIQAKDKIEAVTDEKAGISTQELDATYKELLARKEDVTERRKADPDNADDILEEWHDDPDYQKYRVLAKYRSEVKALTDMWINSNDAKEKQAATDAILTLKERLLKMANDGTWDIEEWKEGAE